jgi:UDP-N-acetylglucosamine 2-epimerase (non-hydrolysing)
MRLLFIFGTRPEAIKMAPLILLAKTMKVFEVRVCVTGQHKEMLGQVLNFFNIEPDYDLAVMQQNQSLFEMTAAILKGLETVLAEAKPDIVLVQGDATTAFIGALAAYYAKIPVAHIEAGLRSGNKYAPFPEELNRVLVGSLADLHFAPTLRAKENLLHEGKDVSHIFMVGNTVIDALLTTLNLLKANEQNYQDEFKFIDFSKKVILVTGHRRESFGEPFMQICLALKELAKRKDVEIVYPVHLNPNVRKPVFEILNGLTNVHLIDPLAYPSLVWLMHKSYFVLSDSGGIQEEAPSLGKPVLVMREVTERIEGVEAGTCLLVGTYKDIIIKEALRLLNNEMGIYQKMAIAHNPYGDGKASGRILNIIAEQAEK